MVGGHVAALPEETLEKHASIDVVCQNEGVYSILELIQWSNTPYIVPKNVKGIYYRNHFTKKVTFSGPSPIVPQNRLEIDLPGMSWESLPSLDKYRTAGWHSWPNNSVKQPFASIYTNLGCKYRCEFCMINIINRTDPTYGVSSKDSNISRYWSPQFIIKEFDYLAKAGVKNVKIADELFVHNASYFLEVCRLIIERQYDFNIWCYSRVDTCKKEYLDIMKKAGINFVALGIESPTLAIRKDMVKGGFKDVSISRVVKEIEDAGINVAANYMFGMTLDTEETMQHTYDFAAHLNTAMVNFYCVQAYPGSPLYYEAKEKGLKLPETYSGYSQHSYDICNLPSNNLSSAQILKFRDKAWVDYHSRSEYQSLLREKFGENAVNNIKDMLKVKLKRKILGD